MKLKRTIQFIEYSNLALIIGLVIGVFAIVSNAGGGIYLAFQLLIVVPFLLAFFLRKVIINIYLKKTLYPGAFYSVLDKLDLTRNLDIPLTDDLLNEIYKPTYSTSQFLTDNNLKTEIGAKKTQYFFIVITTLIAVAGLIYVSKFKFEQKSLVFIGLLAYVATYMYVLAKGMKQKDDSEPITFFREDSLELPDLKLNWKDIFDWAYQAGGKYESNKVLISYYDANKDTHESVVNFSKINIDKIDFLLLMAHFKGKYG